MDFRTKLTSELIQLDTKQAMKKGHNRFAIGIYLRAVDTCVELIADGMSIDEAFSETFTASRDMHGIAKRIGLKLDVQRGNWILT